MLPASMRSKCPKLVIYLAAFILLVAFLSLLACLGARASRDRYEISAFGEESAELSGTLYVAAGELPDACRERLLAFGLDPDLMGPAMPVFAYEGGAGEEQSGSVYWLPAVSAGAITGFYIVSADSLGFTPSPAGKLNALADKTGPESPLYLVADDVFTYAVIGDTAYHIGDAVMEADGGRLPRMVINSGEAVTVAVIA